MEFKCNQCNNIYKSYQSRWNHIKKHHTKVVVNSSTTPEKNVVNCSTTQNNQCKYCNKILCDRMYRWKHEQKCKNKVNETSNDMSKMIEEMKKQNEELKLMLQKALKIHPKTLQKINNQLNNTNNGVINYNIVQLGNENLDEVMSRKEKKAILNKNAYCINELIKKVHISNDDKYKKFKNIYITNLQNDIAYKYDETLKKFLAVDKNNLLERLIDCRMFDIEAFLNDFRDELDLSTVKVIERFIQKIDEDEEIKGIKMKEIKLLLYNGKDEIMEQIKKIDKDIEI